MKKKIFEVKLLDYKITANDMNDMCKMLNHIINLDDERVKYYYSEQAEKNRLVRKINRRNWRNMVESISKYNNNAEYEINGIDASKFFGYKNDFDRKMKEQKQKNYFHINSICYNDDKPIYEINNLEKVKEKYNEKLEKIQNYYKTYNKKDKKQSNNNNITIQV